MTRSIATSRRPCFFALLLVGCSGPGVPQPPDAGVDTGTDAGVDTGPDAEVATDAGAGTDAGVGEVAACADPAGDGAPMDLVWLSDTALVCNDGTPAGYYLRRGHGLCGARRFVIHLQGGGMCFDAAGCRDRWEGADRAATHDLMTSDVWVSTRAGQGIHSTDPAENPDFHSYWHVYVPYCSSDLWTGDHEGSPAPSDDDWHFRGGRIFEATIAALDPIGLRDAELIVLSGSSAGGAGALENVDELAASHPLAIVVGIDDAGWFVDVDPYDPLFPSAREAATLGAAMWEATPDESCGWARPGALGECYVGPLAIGEIATPTLVQLSQLDPPQIGLLGVTLPLDAAERAYIDAFGAEVRRTLSVLPSAFSPRTRTHGILLDRAWSTITADGIPLRDLVGRFVHRRAGRTVAIEPP